ncbi:MAG: pyruvate formate-lyase-activating protein [Kiritimatiellae bacterium]|nr:pyruvate formate-lyase-activating protein [Kiritimatiellia bacterium]
MKGKIHSFETFGSVDGPGVRFLVFLSGCGFRCKYCHNPDTWGSPAAFEMSADEVLAKALRYREYWGEEGGITVSGGEPLLQLEFLTELFEKAKAKGINTCIDTAVGPFTRAEPWFGQFRKLLDVTDLLLLDLKHINPAAHRELTGADNANVLDCAKFLSGIGKPVWIRHVLVPGVNADEASLVKLGAFIKTLANVKKVEVLPYHTLGVAKWKALNLPYALEGVTSPSAEELSAAEDILKGSY